MFIIEPKFVAFELKLEWLIYFWNLECEVKANKPTINGNCELKGKMLYL